MMDLIDRQAAIDAIKGLPTWWADEGGYYGGAQPPMEALLDPEDAVSAIENLPSAQPKSEERTAETAQNVPNDELISKKAAIEALEWTWAGKAAFDAIKNLPSAQPDNRLSKIADLVEGTIDHFDLDDAMDLLYQIKDVLDGSDELPSAQTNLDRIYAELSKAYNVPGLPEEAIGIIGDLMVSLDEPSAQPEPHYDEWCDDCKEYDKERHCCPRWNKVIRETLKDIQPERKKGEWTKDNSCPFCGFLPLYESDIHTLSFCPNCGADMRGEKHDAD